MFLKYRLPQRPKPHKGHCLVECLPRLEEEGLLSHLVQQGLLRGLLLQTTVLHLPAELLVEGGSYDQS
jgi:hypothetical protein